MNYEKKVLNGLYFVKLHIHLVIYGMLIPIDSIFISHFMIDQFKWKSTSLESIQPIVPCSL